MNGHTDKLVVTKCVGAALNKLIAEPRPYLLLAVPLLMFGAFEATVQSNRFPETAISNSVALDRLDPVSLGLQVLAGILYVMLFANVVRFTLLGPASPRNGFGFGWGWRETHITLRGLLIGLPMLPVAGLAYLVGPLHISGKEPGSLILIPVMFVFILGFIYLAFRSIAYLTAPALDSSLDFRFAFAATRGNVFRIFLSIILVNLPFSLAGQAAVIVTMPPDWMTTGELPLFALILLQIVGVLAAVATAVVTALIYEFLFPRDEKGDAQIVPKGA